MRGIGHKALILLVFALAGGMALSACSTGSTTQTITPPAVAAVTDEAVAAVTQSIPTQPQPTADPTQTDALPAQPTVQPTGSIPETASQTSVPTDAVTAFPDPGGYVWAPVVSGLTRPLDFADTREGKGHFLVLEQPGRIRVIENGALLPDPFLDITAKVGSGGNEQGLLGIALHSDYANNGFFYVNYTDKKGDTVIARYTRANGDPNHADAGSEKVLLQVDQPFENHNGGSMGFGPDGYLYMGLGDGGSGGDPHGNGQSLNTFLGKLLRVDVNNGDTYAIPTDNPFAKGGGKAEIWAYGLRNPWRFSFDRLTGDLFVADVGQNLWEEVDFQPAGSPGGADFGWNVREGKHLFRGQAPAGVTLVDPIYEYKHPVGCSVTGGYVYRGQALPEFRSIYLFSDFCSGTITGLLRGQDGSWQSQELFKTGMNVTAFGQDGNGELYLIDQASGGVYRLQRK